MTRTSTDFSPVPPTLRMVLSCSTLAARAAGHEVYTLEGLYEEADEFIREHMEDPVPFEDEW